MLKSFVGCAVVALIAGSASAELVTPSRSETLTQGMSWGGHTTRSTAGAIYSNIDNFSGSGYTIGGVATGTAAANRRTYSDADDIFFVGGAGQGVKEFTFSTANYNTAARTVSVRIDIWAGDGASGLPGTLIFSAGLNSLSLPGSSINLWTVGDADTGPDLFTTPAGGYMWAGITFINRNLSNNTALSNTVAQMNNFGQGLFNPPVVGSSLDLFFSTDNPAGATAVNNPVGALYDFGHDTDSAAPLANMGWEFVVPAPGAMGLAGMCGLMAARRRR